ncbi:glycosyltransferase, partial [Streptomyces albidoflavus]
MCSACGHPRRFPAAPCCCGSAPRTEGRPAPAARAARPRSRPQPGTPALSRMLRSRTGLRLRDLGPMRAARREALLD